jgi:uncharacterized membrane protein YphA (DoxX/SURF4 family)
MLVVAFTNGIFDLYELPAFQNVHTLSVTRERISSAAFNAGGNWVRLLTILSHGAQILGGLAVQLALFAPLAGSLLVCCGRWRWRAPGWGSCWFGTGGRRHMC